MFRVPHITIVMALLCLAAVSCQQTIPDSRFDARATDQAVRNLAFTNVRINRSPDRKLLTPPDERYILGPGDIMEIEIAEVGGTLARTFVMPDGMVYYNLAGGVRAEGLSTTELAKRLQEALKRDYANPLVNVSLVEVRSRRYWILGRVFKPGLYPLRQPTTLLEAISEAGGLFTSRFSGTTEELADLGSSVVIRNGQILPVNFEKLVRSGDTSQNIYLRHNDYIYLPSAAIASTTTPSSAPSAARVTRRAVNPWTKEPVITSTAPTPKAASEARETDSTTTSPAAAKAAKNRATSRCEVCLEIASPRIGIAIM